MRKYRRYLVALVLALAPGVALAGLGLGLGSDEIRSMGMVVAPSGCTTNLVFDQTVACNAIAWGMFGK